MRTFVFGLILTLSSVNLVQAEPRLRIGVESADSPISFTDPSGKPTGFTVELLQEMERAGLTDYELVVSPWSALARDFQAGKIDVLGNVAITAERRAAMDFSIGHAFVHGLVYSRPDHPPIRSTADFAGKTIGTLLGSIAYFNAIEHGGWGATIRPFSSPQEAMDATQRGECDGVLLVYGLDKKYITNTYGMRREFVEDIVHQFRFAVHKGDAAALARLNDALATVRHNGTFDRLYDTWIGPIEPHPIRLSDLRPYAKPILLGFLAIAAILWWQRHMLGRLSRHTQALRESEERFHGLVDSAFEGWIIHQDGVIVMANAPYAATFGYTVAELTGRPVADLMPPAPAPAPDPAAAGRPPDEATGLRKDGTEIPIRTASRDCTFNGKPARIVAVRDLSAEKQAANDQLVLSKLESTGILAGGIAHDFNNLLATIVLSVDMALINQRHALDSTRYLAAAKDAAANAKHLTQQLITFAHGGTSLREPTDLAQLVRQAVPLILSGSNLRAEISAPPDLWRTEVDAGQIERVIGNLVLNAREAMPEGGVVTLQAENVVLAAGDITTLPAGEYVHLRVVDRGRGIPADILPKIFDPYFSTKARGVQKGMGLGLTISHSIVHQHQGALTVESSAGVGTTFHLHLPASHRTAANVPTVAATPATRPGRILVMDDEPGLRDTVRLALEHEGYTVEAAAEGGIAIDLYQKARAEGRPFDVVLLDLTVRDGMGGLETIKKLRAIDPAVKGVVMSGYVQEAVLRDFAQHGFYAALTKPFDLDTLRNALTPPAA
ncbi:MAG: transporter substrate-binding domain-containing protein [Verrucomicrobia bacterium]|nr:transporter substrate-binding domain-containing protein [Verrucomicrobiota bacterium]